MRQLHPRRLLDLINGSAVNAAKTKIQNLALDKVLHSKELESELNAFMRANSPAIYIVDVDLIVKETLASVLNYSEKIFSGLEVEGGRVLQPSTPEFKQALQQSISENNIYKVLRTNILAGLTSRFPQAKYLDIQTTLEKEYSALVSQLLAAESRKSVSYKQGFRIPTAKVGAEIRRYLNTIGTSILSDGDRAFSNVKDKLVFISYRFDALKADINPVVQTQIVSTLTLLGLTFSKTTKKAGKKEVSSLDFQFGNVIDVGHVGLYRQGGAPIGINMPSANIAGIKSKDPSAFSRIEKALLDIPTHIEYGVEVNTNYTNAGLLLDLQFNITVTMPSATNRQDLNLAEQRALREVASSLVMQELSEALKTQIREGLVKQSEILPNITNSPSILEFIGLQFSDILSSGNSSRKVKSHSNNAKSVDLKVKVPSLPKPKLKSKIAAIKNVTVSMPRLRNLSGQFYSLASLQRLLDANLAEKIKQNMGSGSRRDILNLRSGRFAESAKVERMSQSREGMITAFYTYMKNPYATFSTGGRQEFPRSRDPKLLIAKSIREIAATQVANRMRAVLI